MNEFGIDSVQLSNGQMITAPQIAAIEYFIAQPGWLNNAYNSCGNITAYQNLTMTVYAYAEATVNAMVAANKGAGIFCFSHAWNAASAIIEANKFCDLIDTYQTPPNWPVFLDWEHTGNPGTGAYNALINAGITPTTAIVQEVTNAWVTRIQQRGYIPGLYTGGALAGSLFTDTYIQSMRANGMYYWEAAYNNLGPMHDCDVWQQDDQVEWMGVRYVDYNYVRDDRIMALISGGSVIPTWLKIYLSNKGSEKHGRAILL